MVRCDAICLGQKVSSCILTLQVNWYELNIAPLYAVVMSDFVYDVVARASWRSPRVTNLRDQADEGIMAPGAWLGKVLSRV